MCIIYSTYTVLRCTNTIPQPCFVIVHSGLVGASSGGTVFTRWGRTTCPETPGTELVYSGIVAASHHTEKGGGANYLCLPNDPQPLETTHGIDSDRAKLYGVEYDLSSGSLNILASVKTHNAPCVVCYTSQRATVLTMPGKPTCPSSWTLEYAGYLVADRFNHNRVMFECMDKEPECIPGSAGWINGWGGLFKFTEVASCTVGIPCPPYSHGMELSCAMCTK